MYVCGFYNVVSRLYLLLLFIYSLLVKVISKYNQIHGMTVNHFFFFFLRNKQIHTGEMK